MKFPICNVCLKSDMLCKSCSDKIKASKIQKKEVEMFRHMNTFLKGHKYLKDTEVKRIITNKNMMLIITKNEDVSRLIGKSGGVVKKLAKDLEKQVRIIGENFSISDFAREIFFSTPILGVNVVYTVEKKKYRVRIPSSERVLLPITPEVFSEIAGSVFDTDVELVFE